ncbi:hypothetical protein J5U22_01746 [Saccharolobus shibatae]|uniref:PIN domain-containing protein n=2 Tax=Saccharolobus shibatae TaxID=2286 RepID=A0A8F5C148_9CREN|nr:hypothetical protein J5U21_01838 [Saccharolobus shibatae]QXJ35199.1 hypothetical protein J5U22_01746 [Saccharolobus shibatae]
MDTSFLIDWVRYENRDLLFDYYSIIFLTESVLYEIRTEKPLLWISEWLAKGRIKILEETIDVRRKALLVVDMTRGIPLRSADYPEAVCLVLGKEMGLDVLTENGGIFAAKEIIEEYSTVNVYRGIDVLYLFSQKGLIKDFISEARKYINTTKHTYSREIREKYGIEI